VAEAAVPSFHRLPMVEKCMLRECTRPSSSANHQVAEKLGALLNAYAAKNRDYLKKSGSPLHSLDSAGVWCAVSSLCSSTIS
jgi:hypothetical protein